MSSKLETRARPPIIEGFVGAFGVRRDQMLDESPRMKESSDWAAG